MAINRINISFNKIRLIIFCLFISSQSYSQINDNVSSMLDLLTYVANSYQKKNDLVSAEKYYLEVKDSALKYFGVKSIEYEISLNNLGLNYYYKSDYQNAELCLKEAAKIKGASLGTNYPDYASSLLYLGLLYMSLGDYQNAEKNTKEATIIFKHNNLQELYTSGINNLGIIYFLKEDYLNAEQKILEGLELKRKISEENTADYAKSLLALGILYINQDSTLKAEKCISNSASINKILYGEDNVNYASNINLLASIYTKSGQFKLAEKFHKQAYNIFIKKLGDNNIATTSAISGLNYLYESQRKIYQADSTLIKLIQWYKNEMKSNFSFMSMSQSLDFIKSQERNFSYAYSYLSRNRKSNAVADMFDMDLFIRNITLNNSDRLELLAKNKKDSSFIDKWLKYKKIKESQSNLQSKQVQFENENRMEEIEKEIMSNLPEYKEAIKNNDITWKDIRNNLGTKDVVISYVNFRYYSDMKLSDSVIYAAFVLTKEMKKPLFINLCSQLQLKNALENLNNNSVNYKLYSDTSTILYKLIIKPIDKFLVGSKRIYISPSGLLNRISFPAIITPTRSKLLYNYEIKMLLNVRTIAEKKIRNDQIKSISLFGDIDYDNEPNSKVNFNANQADSSLIAKMRSSFGGKWGYLKSTGIEVSEIAKVTTEIDLPTTIYKMNDASEENFKKIVNPSIIHLATHGFTYPLPKNNLNSDLVLNDLQKNIFKKSIDPLNRSGLILSGGNQMWEKGLSFPNHEDGILTANEVSKLDFNGCVLATLSACETGLGDLTSSEGVFGLQRAFKLAGVRHLIVSLWKVPDAETAEFMRLFYIKWLRDKNEINEAFRNTQIEMSRKYNEPYKWAGFILIE